MGADLRRVVRVAYLRMFLYTVVTSFVLLAGSVTVYDYVLQPLFGVYDLVEPDGELVLFAMVAAVPMVNCARLLFVARISGKDALELFTPASLLGLRGIELVVLIALVPFLSRQLFEATGLPNVLQSLTPLVEFLFGQGSIGEVQQVAVVASVLYLYPSIILVYLSHSKLSRLYPFTQFLSIARSWNYALLVATTIPVVLLNIQILNVIDQNIVVLDMALMDPFLSDLVFIALFVTLSTLMFQFVFLRLGSIVVTDREMKRTFAGEVAKEVQTTLSQFA